MVLEAVLVWHGGDPNLANLSGGRYICTWLNSFVSEIDLN